MEKTKIESVKQFPLMPLTIEDMTWNKTGTWRLLTPKVREKYHHVEPPARLASPLPISSMLSRTVTGARHWSCYWRSIHCPV